MDVYEQEVDALRTDLLNVCKTLADLSKKGIRIEFNIVVDNETQTAKLSKFTALRTMNVEA